MEQTKNNGHNDTIGPQQALANLRHEFGEHGGVNMSIEASTTFTVLEAGTMPQIFEGKVGPQMEGCYLYSRHFNPTVYRLSQEIAAIEGTESAYCTASGMSAISSTLIQCCDPGDHIVASNTLYGGTFALLAEFFPKKNNYQTTFVNIQNFQAIEEAFTEKTKVLYIEMISNPTLKVADIPKLAEIAHKRGALLVVDNTFSPLILSPSKLGADIIVHSLTKFINGVSDIVAGAVCGSKEFIARLIDLHHGSIMLQGPTMDPKIAFEISMRLPHLALRMQEHSRRGLLFAQRLERAGVAVTYPGLESHPQHALINRDRNPEFGYGGLVAIDLKERDRAYQLMEYLQNVEGFGYIAVSLGYFDSLMSCSASSTSSEMSEEALASAGISQGLVRFSLGYTGDIEQRWNQLERGLQKIGAM